RLLAPKGQNAWLPQALIDAVFAHACMRATNPLDFRLSESRINPFHDISSGCAPCTRGPVSKPVAGFEKSRWRICHNSNVSFPCASCCSGAIEMRTFMIAAIIAVLAVPAHAQMGQAKGGGSGGKLGQKSDEQ